jgi:hypothetical protein
MIISQARFPSFELGLNPLTAPASNEAACSPWYPTHFSQIPINKQEPILS